MWISGFCFLLLLQWGAAKTKCTNSAKLDLQIIVDSSGSVGLDHFRTMMQKISKSMISQLEIGNEKTRVALFKYSMPRVMINEFSLSKYSKKVDLQSKIEKTEYAPGWTMTAMAMEKAFATYVKEQRMDATTARVCMVFTDGEATDKDDVPAAAQKWAKDGVSVFAIGIGKDISHDGLKAIAGNEERVLEVENFEALGEMAKTLLKKVCETVEEKFPTTSKPVETKPPKPTVTKHCVLESDELVPVDFRGGNAGASSSLSGHGPSQAFELNLWKGAYLPWANLNTAKMPQTVWYDFPTKVTVAKFAFSSRSDCCLEQSPLEFHFVGSDDCANWKVIESYKTQFTKMSQEKSWTIPMGLRNPYRCIGIKVLKVKLGAFAAIQHLKLWMEEKLVLIDYKGGNAGATSSLIGHGPSQAFELNLWKGAYLPWANLNTAKMPQTVWYDFPTKVTVAKFTFSSRSDCCLEQSPLEFQFVGSDDCANWKVIESYKTQFTKMSQEKSWTIPMGSRNPYKCFGIKVLKVKLGAFAAIQHLKLWMKEKLVLIDYEGGNAGATSSLGGHGPSQAFELNLWKGAYLPWANLNTAKMPQTVWYNFPTKVTVAKFAFSSRSDCCLEQSPLEFQFVGSDDCANWKVIESHKTQFTKMSQEKSWTIPMESTNPYKCFGIKVLKVKSGAFAAIQHLKLWTEEKLVLIDYEGGNAGATSSLIGHGPSQAFELNLWKGAYLPWANLNTAKMPQTVWYDFPTKVTVAKFAFSSRSDCCLEQSPLEFQFIGSDDCANWKVIKSYKTQFNKMSHEKSWTIPMGLRNPYKCFGIKVLKVKSGAFAAIQHLKLWKAEVQAGCGKQGVAKREEVDELFDGAEREEADKDFLEMLREAKNLYDQLEEEDPRHADPY